MTGLVIAAWTLGIAAGSIYGHRHGNFLFGLVVTAMFGPLFGLWGMYSLVHSPPAGDRTFSR